MPNEAPQQSFSFVLTREQARRVDEVAMTDLGMPGVVLMENAGRGCVDALCQLGIGGSVVICCGKGNNGGDGLVMARHLLLRGIETTTCLFADPDDLTEPARVNLETLKKSAATVIVGPSPGALGDLFKLNHAWIVDALLGTGFHGDPRTPLREAIAAMNETETPTFAVDLPSGLDCDTGRSGDPTIRATHTCTLVAPKPGMLIESAAQYVGRIHVADIGCPEQVIREIATARQTSNPVSTSTIQADLANPDHIRAIVELLNEYASDPLGRGRPLDADVQLQLATRLPQRDNAYVLLTEDEQRYVGVLVGFVSFSTFAAGTLFNIHDVAVSPSYRNRGIGRSLMGGAELIATEIGCRRISLEVRADNEIARRLYLDLGYQAGNPQTDAMAFWWKPTDNSL